ncbi:hypothetical protein ACEW7V_02795 [Areca yellow leaf disease phytoplasma]
MSAKLYNKLEGNIESHRVFKRKGIIKAAQKQGRATSGRHHI